MNFLSRRAIATGLAITPVLGCGRARSAPISLPQQSHDNAEGLERKARSEAILRAEHVPILESLPVLDPVSLTTFRDVGEVADRALCLVYVAALAETEDHSLLSDFFGNWAAQAPFSPEERAFVSAPVHSQSARAKFSWRYEALAVLAWALGHLDGLGRPDHQVDVATMMRHIRDLGVAGFRQRANMRSGTQIVDLLDLTYRYDWAAVDARANNRPTPAGLSEDVIVERHTALNWITRYMDQDWDDVSTDT